MQKHMKIVLIQMCSLLDVDYDSIDFIKQDWYRDYEWTPIQRREFSGWLLKYMKNTAEARKELMRIPTLNENTIKKFIEQFILNYGWKEKITGDSYESTRVKRAD